MKTDIFERLKKNNGPLGQWQNATKGTLSFPYMEGKVSNTIAFNNTEMISWSYNNYLGLADCEKIKAIDKAAFEMYPWSCTMGSRMMTGNSKLHDAFEKKFANMVKKEAALLMNIGYQGMLSVIQSLVTKNDIIVADELCHACVMDALKMHKGMHFLYKHNDMISLEECLETADVSLVDKDGGILVITEGVFSMNGQQGKLEAITALKAKYHFRILLDDAHGFGVLGEHGRGTHIHQKVENEIDLYFTTFTKSMVSIGACIAGNREVIDFLLYNTRSQIFSKSLPMPIVYGLIKRLDILYLAQEQRKQLNYITTLLQDGLRQRKLLDNTVNSAITPIVLKMEIEDAIVFLKLLRDDFRVFCSMVIYPVVPKGIVMIRMVPTAIHTASDVYHTLYAFDCLIPTFSKKESVYA